jgi:3-methylfumaryl-CoA hydratase
LPLLWHWVYLLDRPARADQSRDGHSRTGIPAPPAPGLRRKVAGGRIRQHVGLRTERTATRRTWLANEIVKQGRSGRLVFATARSEIRQEGVLAVEEELDIVYRDPDRILPATATPMRAPVDGWTVDVDPVLLFRFSALTYNGHRIHYDRAYARDVEGYPGLVVHGPLPAILMAELARASGRAAEQVDFSYRLVAPLFEDDGLVVTAVPDDGGMAMAVHDATRRQTASSTLRRGDRQGSELR